MSAALELVQAVEANGGRFRVDGEYLVIAPEEAAAPMMEELRRHKPEILEILSARPQMPAGVRLIRWEPKNAPVQLSRCETVLDVEKFARATLLQIDARLHSKYFLSGNWPLSELLERLAAVGCIIELHTSKAMLQ